MNRGKTIIVKGTEIAVFETDAIGQLKSLLVHKSIKKLRANNK